MELRQIVESFIEKDSEGSYWDFKQNWHSNNADLLKDIICMANNTTKDMQDGYIIFGIEDSTFNITGVSEDRNRKNQENIIGFLSSQVWSGEEIPNVEVKSIEISGKEVDVLIIYNSTITPYYLLEDYSKTSDLGKSKTILRAGVIYSRVGVQATRQTYYHIEPNTYWINELGLSLNRMTDSIKYYAYMRDGIEFLAFKMFFTKQCYEGQEAYNKALRVIPVFKNEQEHMNFMDHVKTHAIEFKTAIEAQSVDEMFPEYAQRVETVIVYKFGKTLVEWLYQWRWKIR